MVAGIRRRIFASATPTFVGGENYGTIVVDALAALVAEKREVHASILGFLPMEFLRNMGIFRDNRCRLRAILGIDESIIRYKGKWLQASVLGFLPVQHPLSWEVQLWNSHCHDAWPELWQERKKGSTGIHTWIFADGAP